MICYPVLIPTLNRYEHFKNCVESLSRCRLAENTDLIIGLDYPPSSFYEEGYKKIKAYLSSISGFKNVIIFERKENYGVIKNLEALVEYTQKIYDAYILSEDDNIFAETFLEFMNSALQKFRYKSEIISVCGYQIPLKEVTNVDYIMTLDNSAWGVGRWSDKVVAIDRSDVKKILLSYKKSWSVYKTYPICLAMLKRMYVHHQWYGDTVRTVYNILHNKFQVRPSMSLVRNMGHDGTGINCSSEDNGFSSQKLSERLSYYLTANSTGIKQSRTQLFYQGFYTTKLRANISIILVWIKYLFFRMRCLIMEKELLLNS